MKPFYPLLHLRPLLLVLLFPALLLWLAHASMAPLGSVPGTAGPILIVIGLLLLLPAHWQTYKPAQWAAQGSPFDEPNTLVTGGAYAYLRHPQLVGIYLILFGEALWFASWLLALYAALVLVTSARVAMRFEETRLRDAFGSAYEAYASKVKRFVPGLF
jgi:protein-S-isoprenylcysteine O-methyltransferase Ste14